jgi:hypothetical protein
MNATREERKKSDSLWLGMGGALSAAILLLVFVAPGYLNSFWGMDFAVPEPDPNAQIIVDRRNPLAAGKPQAADEWANAENDAVRQHEILLRVDEVETGPLPDKETGECLLIHVRIANTGQGRKVMFEGFSKGKHEPILKDRTGRTIAFLEQRPRKYNAGGPIEFESGPAKTVEVRSSSLLDYQLVFAAPTPGSHPYKLELPAAAWGRQGTCRLLLPEKFTFSNLPNSQ